MPIVPVVHGYAQTNLQLYAQLQSAGWDVRSLSETGAAYELAIALCGGSVRPNGKPFLCHLVGTASIVASWAAPADEVVCALVHSVYTHGAFGDGPPGLDEANRSRVRAAIGEKREALVAAYTRQPWTPDVVAELARRRSPLDGVERSIVRIRLANELEDHLDRGLLFARKTKPARSVDGRDARLVLAEELVGDGFATELAQAIAQNVEAVPEALVRDATSSSNLSAPSPASGTGLVRHWATRMWRRSGR